MTGAFVELEHDQPAGEPYGEIARDDIPTYGEYTHGGDWQDSEAPCGRHCAACQADLQREGSS